MDNPKISIVIPFKQRAATLRVVLESLAEQTMNSAQFEVVVGVMEYSPEYIALCREYTDRLTIVSVLSADDWNVSRARNLALKQVSGDVVMLLDADMALPRGALQWLYAKYFAHGQNICVVGQAIGYHDIKNDDLEAAEVLPYEHYRRALAELEASGDVRIDRRWTEKYASAIARFPWAFVGTAIVALPARIVREHGLYLDEGFRGWGPEDQEWAFRISRTGTPLVQGQNFYAVHLPHQRDVAANGKAAWANNRYYLAKWPRLDLELALAFGGWLEADRCYPEVERELAAVAGGRSLGVVRGRAGGRDILAVGATIDAQLRVLDPELHELFGQRSHLDVLPLAGFGLPYDDGSVEECRVLAPIRQLSPRYRDAIVKEAERAARKVLALA